jgi:HK97 family phage major capsid protein
VKAFERFLRSPKDRELRGELAEMETRADGLTGSAGGVLVPDILMGNIFAQAKNLTAMQQVSTVATVSSGDENFPINRNDASLNWIGETGTRSETGEPTLIERKPTMGTVYSHVKCSEELAYDIAGWFSHSVGDELALATSWPWQRAPPSSQATAQTSRPGSSIPRLSRIWTPLRHRIAKLCCTSQRA